MQYQNVILVLSNGRRLKFTGPAQLSKEEVLRSRVIDIEITEPCDLPNNCTFSEIEYKQDDQSSK